MKIKSENCPYCKAAKTEPIAQFTLPARKVFKIRVAHINRCDKCEQIFMSLYEKTTNQNNADEIWNLYHYYLPEAMQHECLINAAMCSAPGNKHCRCAFHSLIKQIDFSHLRRLD